MTHIQIDGGIYHADQVLFDGRTAAQHHAARVAAEHSYVQQMRTGTPRDPLREIGLSWSYPQLGDSRSQMRRQIATEDALASQRVHCAIAPGATVTLQSGERLVPGDEITLTHLEGRRDALAHLIALGVALRIPVSVAWARSLPSDVGPYVWAGKHPRPLGDGGVVAPGETVTEDMFAAAPEPEPIDPITAAVMVEHRVSVPPPSSEFDDLLHAGKIVRNPNYQSAHKGTNK